MCGHVGVITNYTSGLFAQETNIFKELLFFDVIRGSDATGITLINNDTEVVTKKAALDSPDFLRQQEVNWMINNEAKTGGKALLGHNRKSTIGADTDENAHPFMLKGRFVFYHNGTLKNHKKIHDTEVDSEALGLHLTETEGDTEKLEEALSKVDGAYACVWYDQVKHTVYFLRNKERTLYIAKFENNAGYAYASESWMLQGILERNSQKINYIKSLDTEVLYSLKLNESPLKLEEVKLTVKKSSPQWTHTQTYQTQKEVTPVLPGTTTTGGTSTGTVSKLVVKTKLLPTLAKHFQIVLKRKTVVEFSIDDLIPVAADGEKVAKWVLQDWTVWGTNEDWPGVVFRGVVKQRSYQEMMWLCDNYAYGIPTWNSYYETDGYLEQWLRDVTFVKMEGLVNEAKIIDTAVGK